MPHHLFDVPGWSVPTEPSSSSSKKSKKRKRPRDDASSEKLESVQVNLEKLMDTLDPAKRPPKKKHKGKGSAGSSKLQPTSPLLPPRADASLEKAKLKDAEKPSNKSKGAHTTPKEKGIPKPHNPPGVADSVDPSLTTLQNRMKKKLDGARFR
jgi:ribosomal RNA-processing protein 8